VESEAASLASSRTVPRSAWFAALPILTAEESATIVRRPADVVGTTKEGGRDENNLDNYGDRDSSDDLDRNSAGVDN
jgi:hypothetical protein